MLDGSVCLRDVCAGWECACVGMSLFKELTREEVQHTYTTTLDRGRS